MKIPKQSKMLLTDGIFVFSLVDLVFATFLRLIHIHTVLMTDIQLNGGMMELP
jgi:hypothetical protein